MRNFVAHHGSFEQIWLVLGSACGIVRMRLARLLMCRPPVISGSEMLCAALAQRRAPTCHVLGLSSVVLRHAKRAELVDI